MTSLNDEFNSAEPEIVDKENHGTDTDKHDENAVNVRSIEAFADALEEATCNILRDEFENYHNTVSDGVTIDKNEAPLTNTSTYTSTEYKNDDEINEDVCVSSQTKESDSHDLGKSNSSENELSIQLHAKRTERSGSFDSCTNDLSKFATTVDEDAQTSCNNNPPLKKSDECTNIRGESDPVVMNELENQKSDSKIRSENDNDSDCSSDVEKQSIYLSLSDESDNDTLNKMTVSTPCKTSNSMSPSKIQRSPTSWSPRIQNVTSCVRNTDENFSAVPPKHIIKEEVLSDEMDNPNSSHYPRQKSPSSKPEVDDSNIIIDKNIKLLNIRINLTKIDCSEYLLKNQISSSPATRSTSKMPLRSRRRDNIRDDSPDNLVVKLPKCKLVLQRYESDTEKSDVKSNVGKRRTGKNDQNRKSRRLLGEPPQVNNVASSVSEDGDSDSSECQRNVGKKTNKQLTIRRKRSNANEIVSSTKKSKKTNGRQRHADLEAESDGRKNRADTNKSRKMREVETHEYVSVDKFRHVFNVFYECLCCDQKYHKLDQIKEHVRGHFPDCLTS